jgi:quercetin dioxygenase-like cupin family protein
MPETLKLTPSESVLVRRSTPDMLEVEGIYGPGGSPPPAHFHPGQAERFEVLAGVLRAQVNGHERELRPGETLDIPRGAVHKMWNPGGEEARVLWRTLPRRRTDLWFGELDRLQREGRVGGNGMPGPLAFGVYLTEYRDVIRLAARPRFLIRGGLAVLGVIGRRRYTPAGR